MYDAWGVCDTIVLDENATDIANLNPFRYRSYYLDTGLNLYYLKTRYYDPEMCRFITIDDISYLAPDTINGLNLYAYCLNNPVSFVDYSGQNPAVIAGAAGATGLGLLILVLLIHPLIDMLTLLITDVVEGVTGLVEAIEEKRTAQEYTVYKLVDSTETAQYVGRTKDLKARKAAHERNPDRAELTLVIIKDNLTMEEARGLEQYYMNYYHTLNRDNAMNNQINGISPKNKKIKIYINAAKNYLGNQFDNAWLNFKGE